VIIQVILKRKVQTAKGAYAGVHKHFTEEYKPLAQKFWQFGENYRGKRNDSL